MQAYKDIDGNSGVAAFEIRERSLVVTFKTGGAYLYDYRKPGRRHVEAMKKHALRGDGLATYINQHVRDNYSAKLG